jgi:hypothetical protein
MRNEESSLIVVLVAVLVVSVMLSLRRARREAVRQDESEFLQVAGQ